MIHYLNHPGTVLTVDLSEVIKHGGMFTLLTPTPPGLPDLSLIEAQIINTHVAMKALLDTVACLKEEIAELKRPVINYEATF